MNSHPERLFVVRTWWEPGEPGAWRATLRDATTNATRHFASSDALARFLLAGRAIPGEPEPERTQP